jgi:hypothetical protein
MTCVNCEADARAYTLKAHVEKSEGEIDLPFCSTDCLRDWV